MKILRVGRRDGTRDELRISSLFFAADAKRSTSQSDQLPRTSCEADWPTRGEATESPGFLDIGTGQYFPEHAGSVPDRPIHLRE